MDVRSTFITRAERSLTALEAARKFHVLKYEEFSGENWKDLAIEAKIEIDAYIKRIAPSGSQCITLGAL